MRIEAPNWSTLLPEIPRLVHRYLDDAGSQRLQRQMQQLQHPRVLPQSNLPKLRL